MYGGREPLPAEFSRRDREELADLDPPSSSPRVDLVQGRAWAHLRSFVDVVVLYVAALVAVAPVDVLRQSTVDCLLAGAFPLLFLVLTRAHRQADRRVNDSALDTVGHLFQLVSVASMLLIAAASVLDGAHPVEIGLRLWLFALVLDGGARLALVAIRRRALRDGKFATPTIIVGAGTIGAQIAKRLLEQPAFGLRPVGFVDSNPMPWPVPSSRPPLPVLGSPDALPDLVAITGVRHVILAFASDADGVVASKIQECHRLGVEVWLVPRMYEFVNRRSRLDHVGGLPLLSLKHVDPHGWQFSFKHGLERCIALVLLLLLSPVLLVLAVAVRASSDGEVLFRQRRIGRDGRAFDLLKFRTMRTPASTPDGFVLLAGMAPGGVEGADRRTAVGRVLRDFSLDELPQLINVLKGDMSIVGPRPERPEFVERFTRDVARYDERHRVKSGITGWAQVHGLRGQTSIADRAELDNYYIQNWSLGLDARILVLTMIEVLRLRG